MKILYITTSLFRNVSASMRNISLINGLVENNHEVIVITLNFRTELEDEFLQNSIYKNVKIIKIDINFYNKISRGVNENLNNKQNIFFKLKNIIKNNIFFPDVLCESIKNVKNIKIPFDFDLLVSSSDSKTSHFIAKKIKENKKYKNIKWIQIWGDPWSTDIGLKNINFLLKQRINNAEKTLLKKADIIFYISKLTKEEMKVKYPQNSYKIFDLGRSYLKEIKTENKNRKNTIEFLYAGTLKNRNLKPLLESIKIYNKNKEKKIVLNLYGVEKEKYLEGYDFIKLYPKVTYEEILKEYSNSDVLIYIDNLTGGQIPGKLYDYYGTNKKILSLCENKEIYKLLSKNKRVFCYYNLLKKIKLEDVINSKVESEVLKEYSPKSIANNFLQTIYTFLK